MKKVQNISIYHFNLTVAFQFQESIITFAEEMANRGKVVIVAALDATFQRTEFGKILQLVPIAESVVKLNAICMSCFSDASFTKRTTNEKEVSLFVLGKHYEAEIPLVCDVV